jgi:hypothetical protein
MTETDTAGEGGNSNDMPRQKKFNARERPPGIVIHEIKNMTEFIKKLKTMTTDHTFTIKKHEEGSLLQLKNRLDYDKIKKELEMRNAQHFTWTTKGERLTRYIIHGLDAGIDPEYIMEDLQGLGVPCISVRILGKTKQDIYVATIKKNLEFDVKLLEEIRYICFHPIRISPYKYREPQRCYRCNRYGHSSRNCNAAPRCYRCAQGHEGKDCPQTSPAKCANCDGEHEAGNKECPFYKKAERRSISYGKNKDKITNENTREWAPASTPTINVWEERNKTTSRTPAPAPTTNVWEERNKAVGGTNPKFDSRQEQTRQEQLPTSTGIMDAINMISQMLQQQMNMMNQIFTQLMALLNEKKNGQP